MMDMPVRAAESEETFLTRAIRLAVVNVAGGGGPFGALVVRDGQVLGAGVNRVVPSIDPTAHAEVVAIRRACRAVRSFALHGSTLYSSCEPCPMCLAAAMWARVDRVAFSATRDDAAAAGFDDGRWYDELGHRPDLRSIAVVRVPAAGSSDPFHAWLARVDRQPY